MKYETFLLLVENLSLRPTYGANFDFYKRKSPVYVIRFYTPRISSPIVNHEKEGVHTSLPFSEKKVTGNSESNLLLFTVDYSGISL